MKRLFYILPLLFLWVLPVTAQESAEPENDVDVKGIIFGHLKDSYHWHIITIGEKEVSLQLPVMLYSKVSGWHVFSSRELEETGSYEGFHIAQDGAYSGKLVEKMPDGSELKPLDLSLTKVALGVIINSLLLCVIVMCTARWYRRHSETDKAPVGFVGLMEFVVSMVVDDIIKPSVGKEYKKYAPLLLSLFFFIFFSNIMGLIPSRSQCDGKHSSHTVPGIDNILHCQYIRKSRILEGDTVARCTVRPQVPCSVASNH